LKYFLQEKTTGCGVVIPSVNAHIIEDFLKPLMASGFGIGLDGMIEKLFDIYS
jgi:hypothetical protein